MNSSCKTVDTVTLEAFDNGGDNPVPLSDGRVRAQALMLEIKQSGAVEYHICRWSERADAHERCALTPAVQIFSSHALDSAIPTGVDLVNTRFKVVESRDGILRCYFNRSVSDTATHVFSAQVILSGGDTLTAVTPPLLLAP